MSTQANRCLSLQSDTVLRRLVRRLTSERTLASGTFLGSALRTPSTSVQMFTAQALRSLPKMLAE